MKKFALLTAGLIALGLGAFCACTPDTPVQENPGDNEQNNKPPVDYSEQLGAIDDMTWVSTDGTLDLANQTFGGASSFSITGVNGENADIVISCMADDTAYNLTLNDDGALEMRLADGDTLVRTFMIDASAFAGAWYEEGTSSVYYVISSTLDEDGYFSWKAYNQVGVTTGDTNRAVTVYEAYDDGGAGMFFVVLSEDETEVVASYYTYGNSGSTSYTVYMSDSSSETSTAMTPYTGVFSTTYRNASGDEIVIDMNSSTVTYAGVACVAGAQYFLNGAGIWFEYNSSQYALVYMNEATYLRHGTSLEVYAPYNSAWLAGENGTDGAWSNGSGMYSAEFTDEESVNFNGTTYPLEMAIDSGDLVYTFMVGENVFTIRPVDGSDDVFSLETSVSRYSGYYIRDSLKQDYFQTYTNNSEEMVVGDDYYITSTTHNLNGEDDVQSFPYTFTYLIDLGAVCLTYDSYGQGSATLYFTLINSEGIYWALAGSDSSYAVYATYFNEEYLPQAIDAVTQAFDDNDDYFTTGGTTPETMVFDFDSGLVSVNGTPYYFTWGYGYINNTEPELYIMIEGEHEGTATNYTYNRYTLFPSVEGLSVVFNVVTVDENTGSYETGEDVNSFYVSASTFDSLCGSTFVYNGQFVNSTLTIGEDGALNIALYDYTTDTQSLVSVRPYDYTINLSIDASGSEVITLTYERDGREYTVVITDRLYATINSLTYCIPDLAEVAGTYYDADNGYITLTANGRVSVDGRSASGVEIITEEGRVIVSYTLRSVDYTAVFNGTSVTVTGSDQSSVYDRKIEFTPEKFVGTYIVGGHEIVVNSSVSEVNEVIDLATTIDGTIATSELTYVDGKQVLTFSVRDFETLSRITCTMTLDGDSLAITVNNESRTVDAADWSYADFVFEREQEVRNDLGNVIGVLECVVKEGAPLYLFNDVLCDSYTVSISDGVKTLQLQCGDTDIYVSVNAEGELSVHA